MVPDTPHEETELQCQLDTDEASHVHLLQSKLTQLKVEMNQKVEELESKIRDLESKLLKTEATLQESTQTCMERDYMISKLAGRLVDHKNLHDKKLLEKFTGVDSSVFQHVSQVLKEKDIAYERSWNVTSERMSFENQILLFLMKMRTNLTFEMLGFLFGCSRSTVSNIFLSFLYACYDCFYLGTMSEMPSREKNQESLPKSFQNLRNCRVTIDCTEFLMENPKSLEQAVSTFSHYKSRNTMKILVGVAPNGTLTYISKTYGGSSSDKGIVKDSTDFLLQLKEGDLILADKGFMIDDLLPKGVSLVTPNFLVSPQFTKDQVIRNKEVASARVHVERAIQRMRIFQIVNFIPVNLRPHLNVLFKVVALFANAMPPIIKEIVECTEQGDI